jgi:hypothetical protein
MRQPGFTRKILHFLVSRTRKSNLYQRETISYKKSKKIALVFKSEQIDILPEINNFINQIKKDNKELNILEYLPKSNKNTFKSWKQTHFYLLKKNFNILNIPKKNDLDDFTRQPYDILINLDADNDLNLHYICAMCKAHLKIGLYHEKYMDIYDFMIDPKYINDQESLIIQVEKYLRMINSDTK